MTPKVHKIRVYAAAHIPINRLLYQDMFGWIQPADLSTRKTVVTDTRYEITIRRIERKRK